jgi:hypothetical protein
MYPNVPLIAFTGSDAKGFNTGTLLCDRGGTTNSPSTNSLNGARHCGDVSFHAIETDSVAPIGVTLQVCVSHDKFAFQRELVLWPTIACTGKSLNTKNRTGSEITFSLNLN